MFRLVKGFQLLNEPPNAGRILFSVGGVCRAELERAFGAPQWFESPPLVPTPTVYWGVVIDGVELLLEHTPDVLGVYSKQRHVQAVCSLLDIEFERVAVYR